MQAQSAFPAGWPPGADSGPAEQVGPLQATVLGTAAAQWTVGAGFYWLVLALTIQGIGTGTSTATAAYIQAFDQDGNVLWFSPSVGSIGGKDQVRMFGVQGGGPAQNSAGGVAGTRIVLPLPWVWIPPGSIIEAGAEIGAGTVFDWSSLTALVAVQVNAGSSGADGGPAPVPLPTPQLP